MGTKEKTAKNVADHETSNLLRSLAIGVIILIVFLSLPNFCTGHSHDHDDHHHHHEHDNEPASFKWSRQANEGFEERVQHEPHSHGHDHHHHAHESHTHEPRQAKPATKPPSKS